MTYAIHFALGAQNQLAALQEFIARASGYPAMAARFVDGIAAYCASFRTFRERGMRRDALLPGLRIMGYHRNVTVAFRVNTQVSRRSGADPRCRCTRKIE